MTEICIYLEGGGDGKEQKAELRTGMDALLGPQKRAACAKKLRWKTVPCGGRQQTYEAFFHDLQAPDDETLYILLVDSEEAVDPQSNNPDTNARVRIRHLTQRDGWDLSAADPKQVHLMVRCMEAWIVADPEAVAEFYGKKFHPRSLPNRQNLEDEPKPDLFAKLKKATKNTQKGAYAKIKHVNKLLECIDPAKVGRRCSRFVTFTTWLTEQIDGA